MHDERFCSDWNIFLEETEKTAKVILDESNLNTTTTKTDETVIQSESRTNQTNNFQCGRVACRREVNVSIASHFLTGR